jgi:hypothetical protein
VRSAQPNNQRAMTDEQKEEVAARLLACWKKHPKLRFGQLLFCVTGGDGDAIFNIEDTSLAELMELWSP